MVMLQANPNAEASVAFDVLQPQEAKVRVKSIEEKDSKSTPGNKLWEVRFEFVDPSSLIREDGQTATNPGTLIDSSLVVEPLDKQGRVKAFVLACGEQWANIDSDNLIGKELSIKTKVDTYNGEKSTKVGRYLFDKSLA